MKHSRLVEIASKVVGETQRKLPANLRDIARSVPVLFEAAPDKDLLAEGFEPDLLGLFSGPALDEETDPGNPMPPQIFLYMANLWDFSEGDPEAFRDEVRLTYLHELGHYLGWDEDEVAARGLE